VLKRKVKVWPEPGQHEHSSVTPVVFSPDGKLIATGGYHYGGLRFWKAQKGELSRDVKGNGYRPDLVAFSPDFKILAKVTNRDIVELLSVNTGKAAGATIRGDISTIAVSPDGKMLATAGPDKTVKFWDINRGTLERTLAGHEDEIGTIAFSPDGSKLTTASIDRTVRIWDVQSGRLLITFIILPEMNRGAISNDWIAFTPEGHYAGSPGVARFIRWRIGDQLSSGESYEHLFHRPDLVQKALQKENRK
jgi:WD40 repeat protein